MIINKISSAKIPSLSLADNFLDDDVSFMTPRTAGEIKELGEKLLSSFQDDYEYSHRGGRAIKFIKAALVQTSTAALTQDLLDRTQLAEDARKKRKSVPRRVLRGGGAIHVFEARREIRAQQRYPLSPTTRRFKKMTARFRKPYKRVMAELEKLAIECQMI